MYDADPLYEDGMLPPTPPPAPRGAITLVDVAIVLVVAACFDPSGVRHWLMGAWLGFWGHLTPSIGVGFSVVPLLIAGWRAMVQRGRPLVHPTNRQARPLRQGNDPGRCDPRRLNARFALALL